MAGAGGGINRNLGFTGTQRGMTVSQVTSLRYLLWNSGYVVHHGDCIGADAQAHDIARACGLRVIIHPPINEAKRAWCKGDVILPERDYLDRNHDIVDACVWLVAAPGEEEEKIRSGTWSTVRYARRKGRSIKIIPPDGLSFNDTL